MIVDPHILPAGDMYRWMIGCIVPRPIAFVSTTTSAGGFNVAPFSYFMPIASRPPLIGISLNHRRGQPKDTLRNVRDTGDFVVNIVGEPMLDRMVMASGDWPGDVSEFEITGLTPEPSERVKAPRVAESSIHMECRLHQEIVLGDTTLVVGEIVFADVADDVLTNGRVDVEKLRPIGRLGGDGYTIVRDVVERSRPRVDAEGRPV